MGLREFFGREKRDEVEGSGDVKSAENDPWNNMERDTGNPMFGEQDSELIEQSAERQNSYENGWSVEGKLKDRDWEKGKTPRFLHVVGDENHIEMSYATVVPSGIKGFTVEDLQPDTPSNRMLSEYDPGREWGNPNGGKVPFDPETMVAVKLLPLKGSEQLDFTGRNTDEIFVMEKAEFEKSYARNENFGDNAYSFKPRVLARFNYRGGWGNRPMQELEQVYYETGEGDKKLFRPGDVVDMTDPQHPVIIKSGDIDLSMYNKVSDMKIEGEEFKASDAANQDFSNVTITERASE